MSTEKKRIVVTDGHITGSVLPSQWSEIQQAQRLGGKAFRFMLLMPVNNDNSYHISEQIAAPQKKWRRV